MPLTHCEPGAWYLVVTCKSCQAKFPLFRDLSNGQPKIAATYKWQCPVCNHVDEYEPEDIERYQHPKEANQN
jgi:hypothetical protein